MTCFSLLTLMACLAAEPAHAEAAPITTPSNPSARPEASHHPHVAPLPAAQTYLSGPASEYATRGVGTAAPPAAAPSVPPHTAHGNAEAGSALGQRYVGPDAARQLGMHNPSWRDTLAGLYPVLGIPRGDAPSQPGLGTIFLAAGTAGLAYYRIAMATRPMPFGAELVDTAGRKVQLDAPTTTRLARWFGPVTAKLRVAPGLQLTPDLERAMHSWSRRYHGAGVLAAAYVVLGMANLMAKPAPRHGSPTQ